MILLVFKPESACFSRISLVAAEMCSKDKIFYPTEVAARLLGFLVSGLMPVVDGAPIPLVAVSICVHGDSPGAVDMTTELRSRLLAAGVELRSFAATS